MDRHRLTLAEKLNLFFVAVFSVPVVILAFTFGWRFEQDLKDKAEAAVTARLERTAEVVSRKMEVMESVSAALTGNKALVEYTQRPGRPTAEDLLEVKQLLIAVDRIQTLNPEIVRTRMFIPNPDWPEVWPFIYSETRVDTLPWHQTVARGQSVWRLGHSDDLKFLVDTMIRRHRLVSLFKPVQDPYGAILGSLQVSTTVEAFFDRLFDAEPGSAALWDPVRGTLQDLQDRPVDPAFRAAAGLLGPHPADAGVVPAASGHPGVAWKVLPPLGVVLLAQVPPTSAQTLVPFQAALFLGTLAVLVLAALLFALGTRLVLRRLEAVSAAVRQVRQGQWDVDLPVTGNDEVAELSQTFLDLLKRLKGLVDGVVREQVAAKDAELRALQSQINAHFLYNVLESIRMTAFVDGQDRVADALAALGRTLRYGMEWDRPVVTLKEEVAHAEAYLLLWNLRFGGGLAWEKDLPEGWEDWTLNKFTLQPLVENAVVHGLESRRHRGRIVLEGRRTEEGRVLRVKDNGSGLDEARWDELRTQIEDPKAGTGTVHLSIGLANVHERLRKTFGPEAGLVLEGTVDGWTAVSWRLPPEGDS